MDLQYASYIFYDYFAAGGFITEVLQKIYNYEQKEYRQKIIEFSACVGI